MFISNLTAINMVKAEDEIIHRGSICWFLRICCRAVIEHIKSNDNQNGYEDQ